MPMSLSNTLILRIDKFLNCLARTETSDLFRGDIKSFRNGDLFSTFAKHPAFPVYKFDDRGLT
jgi:hypothetical protein